jgi:hypothetical protein
VRNQSALIVRIQIDEQQATKLENNKQLMVNAPKQ